MLSETCSVDKDIAEIENVFMLLADYTKDIIMGDNVFSEISCTQFLVLLYLGENENVTVNDLVKTQNLTYPACTQQLDELSKLGLINRGRSEKDRRLVFVTITEKGREMVSEINKRRQSALKRIFEDFQPREMEQLISSFSILKNKLISLKESK